MSAVPPGTVKHVVIMVQENHTTDNYFRGLAPWGANVATGWPPEPGTKIPDQPHNRAAYCKWLSLQASGQPGGTHAQFDTATMLPYYLYLAVTGAFLENHCSGFGTNSTPNHLLIIGGQSPTLRNKPSRGTPPPWNSLPWDMPSLPGLANDNGVSWRCYTDNTFTPNYPIAYYAQLQNSPNLYNWTQFINDVQHGNLPTLTMLWHDDPHNEHAGTHQPGNVPNDITDGMNTIWQAVDAVVNAGHWNDTVFMLTYDDWGGFDDHVATPLVEFTPSDNVQLAYGPRVPLLMFGGHVRPGIDSRWCSHVSIPKTAIQLLGLPPLGVSRVDNDGGLADLVDPAINNPAPPPFNTPNIVPPPPNPQPPMHPLPPPPAGAPKPVDPVLLRGGGTLPPPSDQTCSGSHHRTGRSRAHGGQ